MKIIERIKSKTKQLCISLVCIGALMAFMLYATGIYDATKSNIITTLPTIIIIGGTIGYTLSCKRDSKY